MVRLGAERDSRSAAVQASYLLCITGAANLLAITSVPGRWVWLLVPAVLTLLLAGLVRAFPPDASNGVATFCVAVTVFVTLGLSTWASGDRALMTGPGYLLAFVWLGLHRSVRTILLSIVPVLVLYAVALRAAGTPHEDVGSAFVLMPIAGLAGVVIARNAAHLRRAKAEIISEERWRAAIMATLAHDVRSPLTSITGALEVLAEDPMISTTHRSLLDAAIRQAARIMRLATGLLDVERVDQGKLRLDTFEIHLRDLVQEIFDGQPSLDLELEVGPDLLVWADRERLEQIIVNLLVNAAKHGAGPVVVSAVSRSSDVEISVRDHGEGVSAGEVAHLFERLGSTNDSSQSVGLGLWIVRLLTEAHGGTVRYEDADPGARFVVTLPHGPAAVGASSELCIPPAPLVWTGS